VSVVNVVRSVFRCVESRTLSLLVRKRGSLAMKCLL